MNYSRFRAPFLSEKFVDTMRQSVFPFRVNKHMETLFMAFLNGQLNLDISYIEGRDLTAQYSYLTFAIC